jgi:hypothetical protein
MQWFSVTSISIAVGLVILLAVIAYVYGYRRGDRKLEGTLMPFVSIVNIYIAIALGRMGGPAVLQIVFYITAGWGFLRGILILAGFPTERDRFKGRAERPSAGSWIPPSIPDSGRYNVSTLVVTRNPHLKIMAMCPNTNTPVFTGVNSLHWELEGNPPSITYLCSECRKMHKSDRPDTWLEQLE